MILAEYSPPAEMDLCSSHFQRVNLTDDSTQSSLGLRHSSLDYERRGGESPALSSSVHLPENLLVHKKSQQTAAVCYMNK